VDSGTSRLPGTFIQKSFLKLHSDYYWEIVFDIHGNRTVALLALHPPLRPQYRSPSVHLPDRCSQVEGFSVERPAGPFQKPVMVLVFGVDYGLHKLLVAPHPAHIFRRPGANATCSLDKMRKV
jgi:hypothetical protein